MAGQSTRIRVSLVALPDAMVSPVSGLFETLAGAAAMAEPAADRSTVRRFELEIVGPSGGQMQGASGLPITVHRAVDEVDSTDVVDGSLDGDDGYRRLDPRPLPRHRAVDQEDARGRCDDLLRLFRRHADGRDRPARRPRGDHPLGLRDTVSGPTPERLVAHGRGARRVRGRGPDRLLGCGDRLARPCAVPDRPIPGSRDCAGRGPLPTTAVAQRRTSGVQSLQPSDKPWRCRCADRPALDRRAPPDRQPDRKDGRPRRAQHPNPGPPFSSRRRGSPRLPTCNESASSTPSAAWRPATSRSRRSAGRSDTRIPPRSGACSSASPG